MDLSTILSDLLRPTPGSDVAHAPEASAGLLPSLSFGGSAPTPQAPAGTVGTVGTMPMPQGTPPPAAGHGSMIRDLAPLLIAAVTGARNPLHGAAIAHGSYQGMMAAQQENLDAEQRDEQKRMLAGRFLQQTAADVQRLQSPMDRQNYLNLAEQIGVQQFGMSQGWTKQIPAHDESHDVFAALKTELAGKLAAFDKDKKWASVAGTPGEAKVSFQLSNGQNIPVNMARQLVGQAVYDSTSGAQAFAPDATKPPKKALQHVAAIVNGRRTFVGFDPTDGKFYDTQSGAPVKATPIPPASEGAGSGAGAAGAPGGLDPDGLQYAATLFRLTNQMPSLGMGKTPDRGRIINTAAAQAKALGQTPAAAIQRTALYKADADSLKKLSVLSSTARAAESKAAGQIDIIRELSAKVPRTQYPLLNRWILAGKADIGGDPATVQLFNAISTFANEYGKIIEGSTGSVAGSSDAARGASGKLVNAAMNQKTLTSVLDLMQREMDLTLQGYDVSIGEVSKRMGGGGTVPAPAPTGAPAPGGSTVIGGYTVKVGG